MVGRLAGFASSLCGMRVLQPGGVAIASGVIPYTLGGYSQVVEFQRTPRTVESHWQILAVYVAG